MQKGQNYEKYILPPLDPHVWGGLETCGEMDENMIWKMAHFKFPSLPNYNHVNFHFVVKHSEAMHLGPPGASTLKLFTAVIVAVS